MTKIGESITVNPGGATTESHPSRFYGEALFFARLVESPPTHLHKAGNSRQQLDPSPLGKAAHRVFPFVLPGLFHLFRPGEAARPYGS